MKKITMAILFVCLLFLFACSNKNTNNGEDNIQTQNVEQEQIIIEKGGTNSIEEMIGEGSIHTTASKKKGKIKFHKTTIPSMNIAVYDAHPKNPKIIVDEEQFAINNEGEVPYYEIETPLPDLIKGNEGFIKMITKDTTVSFEETIKSQDWKTIITTIAIDTNLDLGNFDDIRLEKTNNKELVNINKIKDIESYTLISNTSTYMFYMYYNENNPDTYYLVGIADGCIPTPCSNIVSIEFL